MPIVLPDNLPAIKTLRDEGCCAVGISKSKSDARNCLKVGLLNLRPDRVSSETQFARLLGSNVYPVEMRLFCLQDQITNRETRAHLYNFYSGFDVCNARDLDALIIAGEPAEQLQLREVPYWSNLQEAMDIAASHVPETLGVCWAAMALAYHHHSVNIAFRSPQLLGCIDHTVVVPNSPLVLGFERECKVPINRWAEIPQTEVDKHEDLTTLLSGAIGGPGIIRDRKTNATYLLNHFEYDNHALSAEHLRDKANNVDPEQSLDFFTNTASSIPPIVSWKTNARVFYGNWMNLVYCSTKHRDVDRQ